MAENRRALFSYKKQKALTEELTQSPQVTPETKIHKLPNKKNPI